MEAEAADPAGCFSLNSVLTAAAGGRSAGGGGGMRVSSGGGSQCKAGLQVRGSTAPAT